LIFKIFKKIYNVKDYNKKMLSKKKNFILSTGILIFLLFFVNACTVKNIIIDTGEEQIEVKVEVADSDKERQTGLMFRESLDENSGMLFLFDVSEQYAFWMKNTLIPLDVIYINEDFKIVEIIYAEPCKQDPCKRLRPKEKAMYVLEVNGNFSVRNKISVGDTVKFK